MKIGQTINGYMIIGVDGKDFSTKGSGLSIWTFVRKDGVEYFMKEFLYPTYPLESSAGTAKLKTKKKRECENFEKHHKALILKVVKSVSVGSNLVFTRDFFRHNTKYYKVTEKIEASLLGVHNIHKLNLSQKLLILKTISHSLDILHKLGIVHGDLKPSNILIKRSEGGMYTSKLIDFDNSYFEGQPPEVRDEVVGDPVYYSPELENYILSAEGSMGSDLSCKSDIFALGVIFCQFLTGTFPTGVSSEQYASNAVNNGKTVGINIEHEELPEEFISMVNRMLLKDPADRPKIGEIFLLLKKISTRSGISDADLIERETSADVETVPSAHKGKLPELNTIVVTPKLRMNLGYKKASK